MMPQSICTHCERRTGTGMFRVWKHNSLPAGITLAATCPACVSYFNYDEESDHWCVTTLALAKSIQATREILRTDPNIKAIELERACRNLIIVAA